MRGIVWVVIVAVGAAVGGYLVWKRNEETKALLAGYARERQAEEAKEGAKKQATRAALDVLKPGAEALSAKWPDPSDAPCPPEVRGVVRPYELQQVVEWARDPGVPERAGLFDLEKAAAEPYVAYYVVTAWRRAEIPGDGSMKPGHIEGTLVVIDRATNTVQCQAHASAEGSPSVHATVTTVKMPGESHSDGNMQQKLLLAADEDLRWQLQRQLGKAIKPRAPNAWFGANFE